ncbi:MAG: hypothetical protein JST82_07730 [Bacteroidetes bacterium]|nr:hypothetical protein [Bacteroidota bacterium]
MKLSILLLVVIGMMHFGANAQSQYAKNYKVCLIDNVYKPCSQKTPNVYYTKKTLQKNARSLAALRKLDSYHSVHPKRVIVVSNTNSDVNKDLTYVSTDGNTVGHANDGLAKNMNRNLTYMNTSAYLAPSDGGISDR